MTIISCVQYIVITLLSSTDSITSDDDGMVCSIHNDMLLSSLDNIISNDGSMVCVQCIMICCYLQ